MSENTGEKETARVEAFSDGVFSIAITLLILEIKVPHLPSGAGSRELLHSLLAEWPSLLAFVLSFSAVLVMWINHHGLFNLIQTIDRRSLFANGLLLLLITFVPFPTAVLAAYINQAAANAAAAVYCGTYVLICLAYNLLWHSAAIDRRLVEAHVSQTHINRIRRAYLIALPIYIVAAVVALFNAFAGLAISSSLWVLWALLNYGPKEEAGNVQAQARRDGHSESRER
jgi:uncharacterized membrane protein